MSAVVVGGLPLSLFMRKVAIFLAVDKAFGCQGCVCTVRESKFVGADWWVPRLSQVLSRVYQGRQNIFYTLLGGCGI